MIKKSIALAIAGCMMTASAMAGLSPQERLSYSLGYQFGENVRNNHIPVQPRIFTRGISDALRGAKPLLPPKEMAAAVENFQKEMAARNAAAVRALAAQEQATGRAFLEKNAKRRGVHVLPDGVQYEILHQGSGRHPALDQTVVADYTGSFINGHVFASTKTAGKPAVFPLRGLIQGLQDTLVRMPVGSTWRIYIPGHLAYGPRGNGPIPPNATLIFTMHLISIK
ncbi:MAG: FKBP-type peptidyl-prolyl cis-trans isomerase [Gammaproteobacteria bacterium]|nr:FKBP-type peptidyl-prolyl cis-trans isomerase [Gammaproteobacteria bacterium]